MKFFDLISRYMAVLSILTAVAAFFFHHSFTSWVNNPQFLNQAVTIPVLLMIIMFGMGLTVKPGDFIVVFTRPKQIIAGELAQFLIMPLLGFGLSLLFKLPPELAVGVILVGCCPGGTSSNVMSFMAKADVPLSIGLTCVSTLLAPVVTPLLTAFYISLYQNQSAAPISVDTWGMFLGILKIVILPISAGILINRLIPTFAQKVIRVLPAVSCIAICIIIGYVIDANSEKLFTHGLVVFVVVILHNMCGYGLGYGLGRLCRFDINRSDTLALEVGMQNSGMASTLAQSFFSALPAATLPGAIFSTWHNISGAVVASLMARRKQNCRPEQK